MTLAHRVSTFRSSLPTQLDSTFRRATAIRLAFLVLLACLTLAAASADQAHAADADERPDAQQIVEDERSAPSEDSAENSDSGSAENGVRARDTFRMWQRTASEQPANVSVLFNAGLAAARSERLGYARLYLERASVLAPLDREVRDTLALVRQAIGRAQLESLGGEKYTEGAPTGIGSWRLTRLLPESLSAILLVVFLWLFALGFLADDRRRGSRRHVVAIIAMIVGLTFALLAGAFWGGARWTGHRITPAVVVAESPVYQTTPDELGSPRTSAELYEGALVAIEVRSDTWSRVRLADESTVWVRDQTISPLVPGGGS